MSDKTQTIYHWASWVDMSPEQADPWFHDILHADGTPYADEEVALIRQLTESEGASSMGRPRGQ